MIDMQAKELNTVIAKNNGRITEILSQRGKDAYFPQHGILAQSAQAGSCKINATIGIALDEDKSTACLPTLATFTLEEDTAFQYAPSAGIKELREIWQNMIFEKNPSLKGVEISLPVATSAITHAIYIAGLILLDSGDKIILSDYFWENYELIFCRGAGAVARTYKTFTDDGLYNLAALRSALSDGGVGKKILLLNFPNNPTGYTPTLQEAREIRNIIVEEASRGSVVAVIIDDAYFGLVFEEGIYEESMFSLLADAHKNILAVKADGATKEDYAWGLRTGFLTFGIKDGNAQLYRALEDKVAGLVREQISSASKMSQSLLVRAYKHPDYLTEKAQKYGLLKKRYQKVMEILRKNKKYAEYFSALPFNSGYFMCIKPKKDIDAEELRIMLAENYSVGTIQLQGLLRIAFSSTSLDELEEVFDGIYKSCVQLSAERG